MAKLLNTKIGEIGVDDLLADPQGNNYVVTDEKIAVGTVLTRGQLVTYDTSTDCVKAVTAAADVPFGIVVDDVDGTDSEDAGDLMVRVYVRGAFNAQSSLLKTCEVTTGSGENAVTTAVSINSFYVSLRERGIILRNRDLA